ncbi:hypothetical protein [Streptomyces sp. SID4917]|uniref:hypothetical protein n=1 Tax=Streptomyces sp. SID4917 TaxID=2690269 RepID=UPI001F1D42C2|nr:hypothetical protein [Streptomyces sp. SID4917]
MFGEFQDEQGQYGQVALYVGEDLGEFLGVQIDGVLHELRAQEPRSSVDDQPPPPRRQLAKGRTGFLDPAR